MHSSTKHLSTVLVPKPEPNPKDDNIKKQNSNTTLIEIIDLDLDDDDCLEISELSFSETASFNREKTIIFIDLTGDDDDDEEDDYVLDVKPEINKPFSNDSVTESGHSSYYNMDNNTVHMLFTCQLCDKAKSVTQTFNIKGCFHSYCTVCVSDYVAAKLEENVTDIRCPGTECVGLLDPEHCRHIMSLKLFNRWGSALCDGVFFGFNKVYCPFKDCAAMIIDEGGNVIKESECPYCRRLFCAQCKVPWHAGVQC
ncbi:hypothetical protein ACFE04_012127 [Oxalis oulophora]